jgi:hypothetical protein
MLLMQQLPKSQKPSRNLPVGEFALKKYNPVRFKLNGILYTSDISLGMIVANLFCSSFFLVKREKNQSFHRHTNGELLSMRHEQRGEFANSTIS